MAEQRIHYLALAGIEKRIKELREEKEKASAQLQEALSFGDLRENSEYDAAKEEMEKIIKELDSLTPIKGLRPIKANALTNFIEEGCVIRLCVYSVTQYPPSHDFTVSDSQGKEPSKAFDGLLMYGGTVPELDLIRDHVLSVNTPVGQYLRGKKPGRYSVEVPAGYVNLTVEKVTKDPETGEDITPATFQKYPVFIA